MTQTGIVECRICGKTFKTQGGHYVPRSDYDKNCCPECNRHTDERRKAKPEQPRLKD